MKKKIFNGFFKNQSGKLEKFLSDINLLKSSFFSVFPIKIENHEHFGAIQIKS
jgi:hypothetical protein